VIIAGKRMNHGNAKELKAHALSLSNHMGFPIKLNGCLVCRLFDSLTLLKVLPAHQENKKMSASSAAF